MNEEKQIPEPTKVAPAGAVRRHSRSLFAPIVLIAAGVLFLLQNLGLIGALDWSTAWRLWPLALIFLGLNVLVTQFRPPLGTLLSGLVAVAAVLVFGFLLVRGVPVGAMRALGLPDPPVAREEPFSVPLNAARTADVTLDLSNYRATVAAGQGDDLLAGTIWTRTGLELERDDDGDHSRLTVGERPGSFMFNPFGGADQQPVWEFRLNPDVPTELEIDAGNGQVTADLAALTLSSLTLDASNGSVAAELPGGDYDVRVDGGNGGVELALPDDGRRELRIDSGNGHVTVRLPEGVEARVEYDTSNGEVKVDSRFERVSGDRDEGAYETAGYNADGDEVLLVIDTGNGAVEITD